MLENFEQINGSQPSRKRDDEFFATRHSLAEYKLDRGIVASDNPEAAPRSRDQWFESDLSPEGIKMAREKAIEFFDGLDPETDALFFVSSDLVRAAETAKIYLDEARQRGFEIIPPRERKEEAKKPRDKAEEIGGGYIRKLDCLTLDHLENMLQESVFLPQDLLQGAKNLDKVSPDTREKWSEARKIIEADNRGAWGANYAAHSEEIGRIFPNMKTAKAVYDSKFKDMMRLVRFGQEKISERNPEKNIKVLAFSHENSFIYFLNKNFGETMKNCESIAFRIEDDNMSVAAKGQTKKIQL